MEAAPESGVLILVPKRRSWKQRNAREWGLKERRRGVGEYWLSKKGSFPTHNVDDGRTRTSNTVGLLARRVDYVLHNYDAGACGGSLLGGVPWNEELLTHSQKQQQQHYSSRTVLWKVWELTSLLLQFPPTPTYSSASPLSTTPTQGLSKLWNKWKDVEFCCCCYILHNELKHRRKNCNLKNLFIIISD